MKHKVSIILPTNRINTEIMPKLFNIQSGLFKTPHTIFTNEFMNLIEDRVDGAKHYLEPTLRSLEEQSYKNFELIISHKYPINAIDIIKEYDVPVKLVSEKHSIWHDLGHRYGTLCNNINTGVIHSSGDLLWRLDDLTFFNSGVIKELVNNYEKGYYSTSRTIRCIDYDKKNAYKTSKKYLGPKKIELMANGWISQFKPLTENEDRIIPDFMCWGCSSTISTKEFLQVNGQNELFDGSVCGTDMELGQRLSYITKYKRLATNNIIYELNDIPYKYMVRDDVAFRTIIGRIPVEANTWKPDNTSMRKYKLWHKHNRGELDSNWNKFMDVPFIDMKKEYERKKLGEVIYDSS